MDAWTVWLLTGLPLGVIVGWKWEQARWRRLAWHYRSQPIVNTTPPTVAELGMLEWHP